MSPTIREATAGDAPAIDALFAEGDAFHAAGAPGSFRATTAPARPPEFYAQAFAAPHERIFVAEQDGVVAGFLHVVLRDMPQQAPFIPRSFAFVEAMVVGESVRGTGIGRALLYRAQGWAREQDVPTLELTVWDFPGGAIPFYEGLGYVSQLRRMRKTL